MGLNVRAIDNKKEVNKFIDAQYLFYKNDKNFVAPLKMDRQKLLNIDKNPFFKHSDIQMFLAERDGKVVGRIAGITNDNHNKTHNDNLGFFGFFECEDNVETAKALFKEAEKWLKSKGKDAIRGPVNPSMNDEVGMLVDGFDSPPVILMTYNPKYYMNLIEKSGYAKEKDLLAYHLVNKDYISDKMKRLNDLIRDKFKITIRNVNFKDKTQFKKDVATLKHVYNQAWQPNWGFVKMTDEEFDFLADDLKQIADPIYTMIAEVDGKVAGFALGLPDINQTLIHNKSGGIVSGLWHLLTKKSKINMLRIIVLGVLPEYQKTGVDSVLYWEMGTRGIPKGITQGEASWILEDNEMMKKGLTTTMKGKVYKTYRLYQKKI
ncbi:MAG: hypothetical protein ACOVNU_03770 [Candidatus Kapaibacteriota bacterium]|jgi:hypothetical protein